VTRYKKATWVPRPHRKTCAKPKGVGVRNKWSMILATQSVRSDAIYSYTGIHSTKQTVVEIVLPMEKFELCLDHNEWFTRSEGNNQARSSVSQ